MRGPTARDIARFRSTVRSHYRRFKRRLPWRETHDPYRILVSEVMLQQTQVDRVVPRYVAFLQRFPTVRSLARAPQKDVLRAWQGLGYNRRALALHRAAGRIVEQYGGRVPSTQADLESLPGIGSYSAGAIRAFAFNEPAVCIETNIRAVLIHHFFPRSRSVRDAVLVPLVEQTLDRKHPREWYAALMDYGAALKRTVENPSRRSAHRPTAKPFRGSRREARGRILRFLAMQTGATVPEITRAVGNDAALIRESLGALVREGFLVRHRGHVRLR
jgi:A/G-specific adenine glycosylase